MRCLKQYAAILSALFIGCASNETADVASSSGSGQDAGSTGGAGGSAGTPAITPALLGLSCEPPADAGPAPEGGSVVFSSLDTLWFYADPALTASNTPVTVEGQPFERARRIAVTGSPENIWSVQLGAAVPIAVEKGDVLLAEIYVRCEKSLNETGECRGKLVFERASDPYTKSLNFPLDAAKDYRRIVVPFLSAETYTARQAQVVIQLGYPDQTIELGGFRILHYGKTRSYDEMPITRPLYAGMEDAAAWRYAAARRIEEHRKSELIVEVVDGSGSPVPNASVRVEQKKHAYMFGSAINGTYLVRETGAEADRYRAEAAALFNTVTIENELKWPALAGDWGVSTWNTALAALDWAKSQNLETRGHVLVWPSWRHTPKFLQGLASDPKALRQAVNDHITNTVTTTRGKLVHWDVVNEPFDNHDLMDVLGAQEMVEWFKLAQAADPDTPRFLNDYAILSGGGGNSAHRDHFEDTIRFLLENGAPLDGLGMQGHFGLDVTAPDDVFALLDRYAVFDKDIFVTEYDIAIEDEPFAACYTRDFMTQFFSHPKTKGFVMWGFWDGAHWHSNAPIYALDFRLKPAGQVYKDLVFREWWTDETVTTNAEGRVTLRGFHGDYSVTVTSSAGQGSATASLPQTGATIRVALN
jgi:GH35 family endo-1,4-beta-xylanase